jgi:pimeloyl-ACP methyl ester carboxylesterase
MERPWFVFTASAVRRTTGRRFSRRSKARKSSGPTCPAAPVRRWLPSRCRSSLYVETLAGALGDLGISKAHVVAHSMGTIVAQHLAIKHPELVKSLALFGPLLAPPEQGRAGIQARAALSREKGIARRAGNCRRHRQGRDER